MQRPDTLITGIWPRAAALLARQALEAAMAKLWASNAQAAGMSGSSMRSQVLCLTAYLDPSTASRADIPFRRAQPGLPLSLLRGWSTAAELTGWLDQAAPDRDPAPGSKQPPAPPGQGKSLCRTDHDASPGPDSPCSVRNAGPGRDHQNGPRFYPDSLAEGNAALAGRPPASS